MPSLLFVLRRSKNFTSVAAVRMPPSVSIDHYLGSNETSKIRPRSSFIIPCCHIQAKITCFEHSNLFKVNIAGRAGHPVKGTPHDYGPDRWARQTRFDPH